MNEAFAGQDLRHLLSRIDWLISTLLKISRLDAGTVRFAKNKVMVSELVKKQANLSQYLWTFIISS